MERLRTLIVLSFLLVCIPFSTSASHPIHNSVVLRSATEHTERTFSHADIAPRQGTLGPLEIEHIGTVAGPVEYLTGRTDVDPSPGSEAWLPLGAPGNYHSAACDGGYFLVGTGGSADFSSPSGTISLWIKWDVTAPNGRFWGQDYDFETRWSGNRLVLDWGGDTTIQGLKSDWVTDQWYFIAITWNEATNFIGLYWGDEEQAPIEDYSIYTWTGTLAGYHSENDIMNSAARTTQVDGHVDDFRYYSIQRSLQDLKSDYNVTLSGSESGLSHYYRFENNLDDSSGSAKLVPMGVTSFNHDVFAENDDWRAEQIQVDVRNMQHLYLLKGSFDSGVPGVNVNWNGDGQYHASGWATQCEIISTNERLRSSYVNSGSKYVTLENEGDRVTFPTRYRRFNDTSVFWYQTVFNNESVEEFDFSMHFMYQRGPIGQNFNDSFEFTFQILNGSSVLWNWSIDPTNITQRGVWYSVGPLTVSIPNAPEVFEARLSLKVSTPGTYIDIPANDPDLDGDSANAQFLTFLVDDISLVSSEAPSCEDVNLELTLEPIGTLSLFGEDGSSTSLVNFSYWTDVLIPFSFSSNTSVSFEYSAVVKRMIRLSNSSSTTLLDQLGVGYTIVPGSSAELSLYTYMHPYAEATNLGFRVYYPVDWENPSVLNPFGVDVTSQIALGSDYIEVPQGLAESIGWWRISFTSPNYAQDFSTQVIDVSNQLWRDESLFRSNDRIRFRASIETDAISTIEITWLLPSGTVWANEIVNDVNSSFMTGSKFTIGPNNATPGIWTVSFFWSNASEIAFGYSSFEVRHRLMVFALTPNVDVEQGKPFTAEVYVRDFDNGNPIMDGVNIVGNWSSQEFQFNPNFARGWFEADFNTSDIEPGSYVLLVNASKPFYDSDEFAIDVIIPSDPLFAVAVSSALLGALAVFAAIVGFMFTRRIYTSTTTRWNLELLALESRIEDAKNLLGVLVIHSSAGLPVYSKMLRGDFQDTILSSFISAISHFRTEFSLDEPKWTSIPITEMIMALQTESFICAIITVNTASERQKKQLESFGLEVGGFYDHDEVITKQVLQTPKRIEFVSEHFNPIFERHFDGALMKRYVGVKKNLPDQLRPVAEALSTMDIDHGVAPDAIIRSVIVSGYNERKAHQLVLEAIDGGFLIIAEKGLPPPPPLMV
ncbi:MAG: hypothetical protein ACFFCP_07605 [Promethearchaeota archaeon]